MEADLSEEAPRSDLAADAVAAASEWITPQAGHRGCPVHGHSDWLRGRQIYDPQGAPVCFSLDRI